MYKKSFAIIIIQFFGSLLGLVSLYFIAGDMEPEVYSLVGIYNIIVQLVTTFSDLGIETTMMREALYWIENGENEKLRIYTTQAILSRVFAFLILIPFLVVYLIYLNAFKYNYQYLRLLSVFALGGGICGLNNAMSLVVRSQGGYVFSQFVGTLNNYVIKFAGLGLYFTMGQTVYLYFYGLSSIPLFFVYLIKVRKLIDIKYFKPKEMFKKVIAAKYLWLKTDLDYFKNNADSLLVSGLFPASIMGSYSIFKTLEQLSRTVIEGFFDVLSQHTVKFKGIPNKLNEQEKKFKLARNAFIALILTGVTIFMIDPSFWINLLHLSKYEYMGLMVGVIGVISIIHLLGKYEINALAFFATSKLNFMMGVSLFVVSIVSFLSVLAFQSIGGVMGQRIITYLAHSLIAIVIFRKNKKTLYTEILK